MQLAAVESVNTVVPSILEGPKSSVLKDPKHNFGAMKTFAEWKPTNGQGGTSARLKEGLEGAWQQIRGVIDLFWGEARQPRGSCKRCSQSTRSTLPQSSSRSSPSTTTRFCSALVIKLLKRILKEVHKVRRFAAEAVSIGLDSLSTNGMFLYAALEELRVLREFARILYATCLKPVCHERCLRTGRRGRGYTPSRSMLSQP